jgi:two-component system OmpR family response regulator
MAEPLRMTAGAVGRKLHLPKFGVDRFSHVAQRNGCERARMDAPHDVLRFADVVLDEARREVFRGGTRIELTATEFNLLRYFLLNPRRVLSKRQILEHVWRSEFGTANVVETYVSYLRRKLDAAGPPMIKTVRRSGYKLEWR